MSLKEKIISESLKLFSSKGFINTSISDIMETSGTSKGGLYNHFRNKEDLFSAVLNESRKTWRKINLEGLDGIDSPIGKIRKILENYRDRYLVGSGEVPGGCIFVRVSVESSDLAEHWPQLAEEVSEGFDRFKSMIQRYLSQAKAAGEIRIGVDVEEITDMIFSSMMGASVLFGMDRSARNLNRNITSLIQYVESLGPEHPDQVRDRISQFGEGSTKTRAIKEVS
jgi:AcrR family transcriptional regulator